MARTHTASFLVVIFASIAFSTATLPDLISTGDGAFPVKDSAGVLRPQTDLSSSQWVDLDKIYRNKNAAASYVNEPEASPPSARVIHAFYQPEITGTAGFDGDQQARLNAHNTLVLSYDTLPAAAPQIKMEAPYLEIDPEECGLGLDCRCNPSAAATATNQVIEEYLVGAQTTDTTKDASDLKSSNAGTRNVADKTITFDLSGGLTNSFVNTYFEHAPFAGQDPYLRTYRRICLKAATDAHWKDTGVFLAVTQGCQQGSNGQAFDDKTALSNCQTKSTVKELSLRGANPQHQIAGASTTQGNHDHPGLLGDQYTKTGVLVAKIWGDKVIEGETQGMVLERQRRTICCGANANSLAIKLPGGREANTGTTGQRYGVCISSDAQEAQCCGRRPYNPKEEKCCNRLGSLVENLDAICPCSLGSRPENPTRGGELPFAAIDSVCDRRAANVAANGDFAGLTNAAVADGSTCCDINKANVNLTNVVRHSQCTGDGLMCCNDGSLYDPATQQCCPVNGVQNLDLPCPCSVNTDCGESKRCCFQAFPLSVEDATTCTEYANYPVVEEVLAPNTATITTLSTGPALAGLQQCRGSCYDPTYQSCCNGNLCESEYERCCNTTCCNTFTSTCSQGLRPGTNLLNARRFNPRDFGVYFEECTEIEHLNGFRAFYVFVLPAVLLFATLISLALIAVVARRATEHIFELTERALVVVAVLVTLLAIPFFFSPLYKWGLVVVLLGLAAIVVAVARRLDASLVLVILALIVLLYVVNPFANNNYIGASSAIDSVEGPNTNTYSHSLFEGAKNLWHNNNACTKFYDYFSHDEKLRDTDRWSNPEEKTFGYCSRDWITALMVLAAALTFLLTLLFLLAIFSYLKKLGYKPVEPIQLELETEQQYVPSVPVMTSQVQPLLATNPVF